MVKIKRFAFWAMTLLLAVVILNVSAFAADVQSGTWKMNPAKSKYSPGPAPKELTVKLQVDEKGVKVEAMGTNADGTPLHVEYSAKFDGKDYPVTGLPYADTVMVERIDANTLHSTNKKDGQVTMTVHTVVSQDGKTRTATFTGKDAQGNAVNNVVVYDKQ
jgi:hypothetical protein